MRHAMMPRMMEENLATLEIHAGDFKKGKASTNGAVIALPWQPGDGLVGQSIVLNGQVTEVTIATEDAVKRTGGTIGWGLVGGAALGPVGLLAGLLLGGKGKDVTFILALNDGRRMLATTDSKTFTKIQALAF